MLALIQITPWYWAGFIALVAVFLALDLGLFHRQAHVVKFKEALGWTLLGFALAHAVRSGHCAGADSGLAEKTARRILDRLLCRTVPVHGQCVRHCAWSSRIFASRPNTSIGCCSGACWVRWLMRGVMIWLGVELIHRFEWLLMALRRFPRFSPV